METATQANDLIQRVFAKRGFLFEWQVFLAQQDPAFLEAYENITKLTNGREDVLPPMYRELIFSAVLSSRAQGSVAKNHIRRALEFGATPQQVVQAIQTAWRSTGSLTLVHGIKALVEVLKERGEYTPPALAYAVSDRDE